MPPVLRPLGLACLALTLPFFAGGCAAAGKGQAQAGRAGESWRRIEVSSGGTSFEMPGNPSRVAGQRKSSRATIFDQRFLLKEPQRRTTYLYLIFDIKSHTGALRQGALQRAGERLALEIMGGKLERSWVLSDTPLPGRGLACLQTGQPFRGFARIMSNEQRIHMLMALAPKHPRVEVPSHVSRFFDSFQITSAGKPVPGKRTPKPKGQKGVQIVKLSPRFWPFSGAVPPNQKTTSPPWELVVLR